MAERPNASVLKTDGLVRGPGVRIPPLPFIFTVVKACVDSLGRVAEWSNASVSKTDNPARDSGVRIPSLPFP